MTELGKTSRTEELKKALTAAANSAHVQRLLNENPQRVIDTSKSEEEIQRLDAEAFDAALRLKLQKLGNPPQGSYLVFDNNSSVDGKRLPVVVIFDPDDMEAMQGLKRVVEHTPSNYWQMVGESDPHGTEYSLQRNRLCYGYLSDDVLANEIYMCDHRTSLKSIGYLTAAKERIRFLSRVVDELLHVLKHTKDKNTLQLATKVQERNKLPPVPEHRR